MDKYLVKVPEPVYTQIESIRNYIKTVLGSPQAAEKMVKEIMADLRSLEIFPERGFDADKKMGKRLSTRYPSRGLIIANKRYIAFYHILESEKVVYVTHLVSSKSHYAKLLF